MSTDQIAVGARIKQAREDAGLTQKELADRVGTIPNTIALYERGKFAVKIALAAAIAKELSVRLDWLATGEGEQSAI